MVIENSNQTKSRIALLRELLGLSQSDFAEAIGITQGALSQIETGKSKISMHTLKQICLEFNASCDWLVLGTGNMFMNSEKHPKLSPVRHSILTMDLGKSTLIPLIREEAHAGYIQGHRDTEYLNTLDVYKIPGFEEGNYRLFEINGDSMIPTIYPREMVVSEFVEEWEKLENGTLCVVITEDGIVAKRLYFYDENKNLLILKSDNSKFQTYTVDISEVHEIWLIKAKITSVFAPNTNFDNHKFESLESDIHRLKSQMNKILNKKK